MRTKRRGAKRAGVSVISSRLKQRPAPKDSPLIHSRTAGKDTPPRRHATHSYTVIHVITHRLTCIHTKIHTHPHIYTD